MCDFAWSENIRECARACMHVLYEALRSQFADQRQAVGQFFQTAREMPCVAQFHDVPEEQKLPQRANILDLVLIQLRLSLSDLSLQIFDCGVHTLLIRT